jgi:hypothetical protein
MRGYRRTKIYIMQRKVEMEELIQSKLVLLVFPWTRAPLLKSLGEVTLMSHKV